MAGVQNSHMFSVSDPGHGGGEIQGRLYIKEVLQVEHIENAVVEIEEVAIRIQQRKPGLKNRNGKKRVNIK